MQTVQTHFIVFTDITLVYTDSLHDSLADGAHYIVFTDITLVYTNSLSNSLANGADTLYSVY